MVNQFEIVLGEFGNPSSLSVVELMRLSEIEVEMIGEDGDGVWRSLEVTPPFSESVHDS